MASWTSSASASRNVVIKFYLGFPSNHPRVSMNTAHDSSPSIAGAPTLLIASGDLQIDFSVTTYLSLSWKDVLHSVIYLLNKTAFSAAFHLIFYFDS